MGKDDGAFFAWGLIPVPHMRFESSFRRDGEIMVWGLSLGPHMRLQASSGITIYELAASCAFHARLMTIYMCHQHSTFKHSPTAWAAAQRPEGLQWLSSDYG